MSRYAANATIKVGYDISETIVTSTSDTTLLDPATGTYNYAAPGADRLKLSATIVTKAVDDTSTTNFVERVRLKNGIVEEKLDKPQYSIIRDYIARRTYDESGDYIVDGLNVRVREHLQSGNNQGLYSTLNGGNSSLLSVDTSPGKAYIHGYDTQLLITNHTPIEKGIDYSLVENSAINANYGNYVVVDEVCGTWDVNTHDRVELHDTAFGAISNGSFSSTTAGAGTKVGEARVRAIEYASGTKGAHDGQYNLYLYDVVMTANSFNNVRSVYHNATVDGFADIVLESSSAVMKETAFNHCIYPIPAEAIKQLSDAGIVDNTFRFLKSFDQTIASGGTTTIDTTSGGASGTEQFPFSTGVLNSTEERENFYIVLKGATKSSASIDTVTTSGNVVIGVTSGTTRYNVGEQILIDDGVANEVLTIAAVASNGTHLTTHEDSAGLTSKTLKKYFVAGQVLPLNGYGDGGARTIEITSSTTADVNIQETLNTSVTAEIVCEINKVNGSHITKTLKPGRLVEIDVSAHSAGNTGPWSLGFSDVFRLNSVRYKTGAFSSVSEGTDITAQFEIDDGQRDNFYTHGFLQIKPNSTHEILDTYNYLVDFDYFDHDTSACVGYYSVDSYPVDDAAPAADEIYTYEIPRYTSPVTGEVYDLRNTLDLRTTVAATATDTTTIGTVTTNPATSNTIVAPAGGLRFMAPNETFTTDFEYYLPRKDRIIITSKGTIRAIRGVPSLNPQTPPPATDGLTLAIVEIDPYPSLPYSVAKTAERTDLANRIKPVRQVRYTMRDIGVLKNRIDNLEYYTSLSLFETETKSMTISDVNGNDRFKNGILVDPFTGHNIGNVGSDDYKIAVDKENNEIRPTFKLDEVELEYNSTGSTGVAKTGDLVTLDYTNEKLIDQAFASDTRNTASLFYNYKGVLALNPFSDHWVDTVTSPDIQIDFDSNAEAWRQLSNAWGTEWNDWNSIWSSSAVANATRWDDANQNDGTSRVGLRTIVNVPENQTRTIGEFVKNVNVQPFMRSRNVQFVARSMKPSTKVYAFFDDEAVSDYCTQANSSYANTTNEGTTLTTDANGDVYGLFRLPNEDGMRFRVGSLVFKLTDSPTNSASATTTAKATYSAIGLAQLVDETVTSTRPPVVETPPAAVAVVTNTPARPGWFVDDNDGGPSDDPIAQTFLVRSEAQEAFGASGMYLTKVDLYFQAKDSTLPVEIQIREVDPTSSLVSNRILPFSTKVVESADVNTSDTAATATTVTFDAPVFLLNDTEYAIVIKPGGNNPNYVVWTSRLGEDDITTGNRISKQPYSGVLFASSNDRTWTPIQEEDLKFAMYFANFGSNQTGTANIKNANTEYFTITTESGSKFNNIGETIHGETTLTMNVDIYGNAGDTIVDVVTGANGTITYHSGTTYRIKDLTTTKFTTSNTVTLYQSGVATANTGTISSQVTPSGVVKFYDPTNFANTFLHLDDSNGIFAANTYLKGQKNDGTALLTSIDTVKADRFHSHLSQINLNGTTLTGVAKLATDASTMDTTYRNININGDTEHEARRYVLARSSEISNAIDNSVDMVLTLTNSANPYHSPAIDVGRAGLFTVENIINNLSTGEANTAGGDSEARYITKTITLADDQDAEDLKVYLTAYKPATASVLVYYKILHGEDGDTMNDRSWIQMTQVTSTAIVSDSEETFDYKEYEYKVPTDQLTGSLNEVQYTNSEGVVYTGYKRFAIKIVLLSSNTSKVPRVTDFRAIALQV